MKQMISNCAGIALTLSMTGFSTSVMAQSSAAATFGKAPSGMMTRDELRTCMNLQRTIDAKAKAMDQDNAKMQADKDNITASTSELETLRTDLAKQRDDFTRADNTVRENTKKLQAWNKELHQIAASPNSASQEKKKQVENDYANLSKDNKQVMAQRDTTYKTYSLGAKQFNIKATSLEKQVSGWNAQDKQFTTEVNTLAKMRTDYASACTNRPFLEADRAAVKAGK